MQASHLLRMLEPLACCDAVALDADVLLLLSTFWQVKATRD